MPTDLVSAIGLKILGRTLKEHFKAWERRRRFKEEEIREFRGKLQEFVTDTRNASVQAQIVVGASPNEQYAQDALREAVRLATGACQDLAYLCDLHSISPNLPYTLTEARFRFRELVTDEGNLDIVDPDDRKGRGEAIEIATSALQREMRDFALREWGIGLGNKAGRT